MLQAAELTTFFGNASFLADSPIIVLCVQLANVSAVFTAGAQAASPTLFRAVVPKQFTHLSDQQDLEKDR